MSERVVLIIPALNEERSVGEVVGRARAAGYDTVLIDDGSTDRTAAEAAAAGAMVVELPLNLGVGGALRCGFRWAIEQGYDIAVQVDADGQHDPEQVAALLDAMRTHDADMVVGSRFTAEAAQAYAVSRPRRWAMRLLAWRVARVGRTRVTDASSGFRAIRRPLLDRFAREYPVEYLGDTVEALIEAGQAGATIVEVPIVMRERAHGVSSASTGASLWYVLRVLLACELQRNRRWRTPSLAPTEELPGEAPD